ncbi:MAG: tryptophan synthase subunit alpha [Acidobacteria bacterium]|nr:tryptophan synthase subunit alpha [Acidobacteriota bacterium]
MTRYETLFARLAASGEGAFVPFTVLGDPDPERSLTILHTLADAGADALELGIPFSDPVADGPTIQKADIRALEAGMTPGGALDLVRRFRERNREIPVGLLVYANLVEARGRDAFYRRCADVGIDSVLVADAPTLEAGPYAAGARAHGIAPVLIAAPNSRDEDLAAVARLAEGYTYVVTRGGVTGADEHARTDHRALVARLRDAGAPPALLGFGISKPEHVRDALRAGAAGAISGSAMVALVERHAGDPDALRSELAAFVRAMKAATRG